MIFPSNVDVFDLARFSASLAWFDAREGFV